MTERSIATAIHGRYLTIPPATSAPVPMLVGFHGYAENAEAQLERLQAIPGSDRWLVVSVQGLHRFYRRRTSVVVASWMTRQDRELAIADNIAYVNACLDATAAEWPARTSVVFAGFSQGVAMAFRAAVHTQRNVVGVIAVGGDIPPEITSDELKKVPAVLLARGASDDLYTAEKFVSDQQRLQQSSVAICSLTPNSGHEWSDELSTAAGPFSNNS
jgi:predicted esterase